MSQRCEGLAIDKHPDIFSVFRISLICPTGTLAKTLSTPRAKNILLFRSNHQVYGRLVPLRSRGVRVVTNVERNAVDAGRADRRAARRRTAKSCGPGAPMSGVTLATMLTHCADNGGKRNGSPGRARISRKPLRREGRLSPPVPVVFALAQIPSAREPRVQRPPGLPCALRFTGGTTTRQTRAKRAARMQQCVVCLSRPD
jgi:hypothetical protein